MKTPETSADIATISNTLLLNFDANSEICTKLMKSQIPIHNSRIKNSKYVFRQLGCHPQ